MPKTRASPLSLAEREELVLRIEQYAKVHDVTITAACKALNIKGGTSAYHRGVAMLRVKGKYPVKEKEVTEHFPLVAIPDRKPAKKYNTRPKDDDKELAAQLLKVAARLLER